MTERLGVPTLISTDSTEGATPSESAMERLLRLMELQQRQSEMQQRQLQEQIQAQVSAQQKQIDALTRIVSTIATQQNSTTVMSEEEVQAEKTKHVSSSSLLKMTKFKKMNPPDFNGRAEPDEVMGWLVKIESLFTLLNIKGSKKVGCAALQLNLRAYDWWEAKKQELQGSNPSAKISWETFKRAFLEQYIPRALRRQKEEEFMSLKQGNLSVEDYDAKFAKLAKFAGAFLPNAEAWCERFQQGLNEDLRRDVMNQRCQTYRESYNAALEMERVFGRTSQKGGSSIRNNFNKRPNDAGGSGAPKRQNTTEYRGPHPGVRCHRCGKMGHLAVDCRGGCFKCGQLGHKAVDCRMGRANQHPPRDVQSQNRAPPAHGANAVPVNPQNRQGAQGRVYALTRDEAYASDTVVTGNERAAGARD
ncbi:uncharacterized protein M6B38_272895 [Iris pallida]|uniref:CCHC-type domain-containing protein n=2 Tax=Iris pallida TaxID=29817 RepID=A0AAX6I7P4_IRIPA|nr:uncharacterized protein M6B38_272895 [Iris pallida]